MDRGEFTQLFGQALESAAKYADAQLGFNVSRHFNVVLHGAGHRGDVVDVEAAARDLYLGSDRFYRVIDVAVVKVSKDVTTCFVRVSSHDPGTFEQTWNDPPGTGPFKQIYARQIELEHD